MTNHRSDVAPPSPEQTATDCTHPADTDPADPADEPADQAPDDKGWLRTPLTDAAEIAKRYDEWADTYEAELRSWGYDAPEVAASMLAKALSQGGASQGGASQGAASQAAVLDLGCGIGLTGAAVRANGLSVIDGIDVSESSLARAAQRGVYRQLAISDFNAGPLPTIDGSYEGVLCVGVLSYAHEPLRVIAEMLRSLRPGGIAVFTHRTDLWDCQNLAASVGNWCSDGTIASVEWTEPKLYMPGNPDFADQVCIRYVTMTAAA